MGILHDSNALTEELLLFPLLNEALVITHMKHYNTVCFLCVHVGLVLWYMLGL